MANTLTGLIPTIYEGLDVVSRELSGLTRAVSLFPSAERAAKDQTITYPVVPSYTPATITPAATGPDPAASTIGTGSMSISRSEGIVFYWTGDEELSLQSGYNTIFRDQVTQGIRALCNEMETDLAALYDDASRAAGAAGTTPFASNLSEAADVRQLLADNGAPLEDLQLVVNTAAGTKLRSLAQFTDVNRAGTGESLRRGLLLDILGFQTRESAQIKTHTKGTASSATTDNAGYSIGDTVITLASAGTGTILAGDAITLAGDSNKYCVTSGDADVSNGGTITLAEPGLKVAIAASATAITVGNGYAANMAFARSAIHLATRIPATPSGGDSADDVVIVTDPVSGLSFSVSLYRQYKRVSFEVGAAWGVKAVKPEHMAILMG